MRFSVSLPTGFEGVMYPVPFVAPEDFVRLAIACERLGYHSVWATITLRRSTTCATCFPVRRPTSMK